MFYHKAAKKHQNLLHNETNVLNATTARRISRPSDRRFQKSLDYHSQSTVGKISVIFQMMINKNSATLTG